MAFSVYDGEELLEASLRAIRPHADYIAVVFSEHSYYGQPAGSDVRALIASLETRGLIDEIAEHKTAQFAAAGDRSRRRELEVEKRSLGLMMARAAGCNYFMTMDTDEFYDSNAVERAKDTLIRRGVTHSFSHILNYGRSPTQLSNVRKWEYFVPFFSLLTPQSTIGAAGESAKAPCLVDSTRILSYSDASRSYVLEDIFMHHYTRVRADLESKYTTRNVSSAIDADWIDRADGFLAVPDYFDLEAVITSARNQRAASPRVPPGGRRVNGVLRKALSRGRGSTSAN